MTYLKYDGTAAVETNSSGPAIYGTDGSDTLTGTAAGESLWGKGGDLMIGGPGDDTYYLQDANDRVVEQAGGGTDMVVAWKNVSLADYPNVENVKIDGDGIYAAGDSHDNIIYAGSGSEQLYGGGGQDVMVAGSGPDTFIVVKGEGNDAIYGFKTASDVVRLSSGYANFDQLKSHISQDGSDVKIDLGGGDGLVLRGVQASQLTAANFQLGLDTSKLGQMTFHDEFSSGPSIWNATYNPTGTWRPDYGYQGANGAGSYTLTGNGELQIYTSPYFRNHNGDFAESPFKDNGDGTMSIMAKPSSNSELFGYSYTSGMISTKESFAQTYGYFEMRAQLPQAAGGWPAFWLVPADGSWPPELDVMETLTNDPHADWTTWHSEATGTHTSHGISSYIPDTSSGFHTYGVLWTKTDLVWYVDGAEVFHQVTPADMNKPMYMIANLALGGWGGSIDNSKMPEEMKIDYIRSYALADGTTTVQGFDAGKASGSYTTGGSSTTTSPPVTESPGAPAVSPPTSVSPPPAVDVSGHAITSAGYGSTLIGGAGADTLTSNQGGETMTGGAGADSFVFKTTPWTATHVTDFQPGVDKLDVSSLYVDGYRGTDPVADGYVQFISDGNGGTAVIVDPDGRAIGHPWGDYVVDLEHVDPLTLTSANVFGGATVSPPASPPLIAPPPAVPGLTLTANGYGQSLTGGAGADTLTAGNGGETMSGGAGADSFVFKTTPWTPTHIADFQAGVDKLDISALYTGGYHGADPIADGYVTLVSDGDGGTAVIVDPDGPATGHLWGDYVVDLEHVDPSTLTSAQLFGGGSAVAPATTASPPPPPATAGLTLTSQVAGDTLSGGAGADTLNASQGADHLTGGAGNDLFVFSKEPWSPATITDFVHGQDKIDLRGLFAGTGYSGSDPIADHYLSFISDGHGGTAVLFDPDGVGTAHQWADYIIDLQGVAPTALSVSDWIIR